MATLIVLGNVNRFTFVNSIIVANDKATEEFGKPLTNIFVIHSRESQQHLSEQTDWLKYLEDNNISRGLLTEKVVEIDSTIGSVERFIEYIEFIINWTSSRDRSLIVDLTNGTTLHKNLLAMVAYILELGHQYLIDTVRMAKLTPERGYLPLNVLRVSYVPAPDATQLDSIAYLNLTKILRYRRIIQKHTTYYDQIDTIASDRRFFEGNLSQSIGLKLLADRRHDNALYRIAASSISASIENLINIMIEKFNLLDHAAKKDRRTFGENLDLIESEIKNRAIKDFDMEFFRRFNKFIVYLRNSSTHKNNSLINIEKFRADLSMDLAFTFMDFYEEIIYNLLIHDEFMDKQKRIKRLSGSRIDPTKIFYFGLDGDNTGSILEELFLSSCDEVGFKKMSSSITQAVNELVKFVKANFLNGDVVFSAGDDILFKGCFNETSLYTLQQMYRDITSGMTCSIGYGRSFQEVYLALRLAKAEPGKNSIIGVELV